MPGGPGPGGSHPRCFAIHPPRRALGRRPCVACRRGATGAAAQGPPRGDPQVAAVRRVVDRCAHPISVRGCPWTRRGPVCRAGPARLKPRRYALQGWRAGRRSVRPTGAACGPRTKSGGARPPVPARRRPNGCVRQGWWSKHRSFRPASAGCRPWTTRSRPSAIASAPLTSLVCSPGWRAWRRSTCPTSAGCCPSTRRGSVSQHQGAMDPVGMPSKTRKQGSGTTPPPVADCATTPNGSDRPPTTPRPPASPDCSPHAQPPVAAESGRLASVHRLDAGYARARGRRPPQPEFLVLRSRGQAGEEGLIIGHQIVDGAARQFRREGLQKGEVGESAAGRPPCPRRPASAGHSARPSETGEDAARRVAAFARPRPDGRAGPRPRATSPPAPGRGDGRLVAAPQASAQIVAQTLLIERQAGGTVRVGRLRSRAWTAWTACCTRSR